MYIVNTLAMLLSWMYSYNDSLFWSDCLCPCYSVFEVAQCKAVPMSLYKHWRLAVFVWHLDFSGSPDLQVQYPAQISIK